MGDYMSLLNIIMEQFTVKEGETIANYNKTTAIVRYTFLSGQINNTDAVEL